MFHERIFFADTEGVRSWPSASATNRTQGIRLWKIRDSNNAFALATLAFVTDFPPSLPRCCPWNVWSSAINWVWSGVFLRALGQTRWDGYFKLGMSNVWQNLFGHVLKYPLRCLELRYILKMRKRTQFLKNENFFTEGEHIEEAP